MRALKTFLRNKKNRCCEWNKCVLVWMWRDFQSYPEFCNCGDWGSTPPVPPVPPTPDFTYSLEKTSTRGAKDIYTASKYDNTETLVKAYSFSIEYHSNDREIIDGIKIWDCTWECVWLNMWTGESFNVFYLAYVYKAENAISAWTQEAFKEVFEDYDVLYNGDNGNVYYLSKSEETIGHGWIEVNAEFYVFMKWYWANSWLNPEQSYAIWLEYNKSTWDLVYAGIDDSDGSFDFIDIPDSSQALALKAEFNSIIANVSQAACKEWFEDARTLYNSLQ